MCIMFYVDGSDGFWECHIESVSGCKWYGVRVRGGMVGQMADRPHVRQEAL